MPTASARGVSSGHSPAAEERGQVTLPRGDSHTQPCNPTCIGQLKPWGVQGAVDPGKLCCRKIWQVPGDMEVVDDRTDGADNSEWEEDL